MQTFVTPAVADAVFRAVAEKSLDRPVAPTEDLNGEEELPQCSPALCGLVLLSVEELGYRILPSHSQVSATYVEQLQSTIARWCAVETVDADDISGPSILQSLAADGWIIVPPIG
jgi:hypothetical protein